MEQGRCSKDCICLLFEMEIDFMRQLASRLATDHRSWRGAETGFMHEGLHSSCMMAVSSDVYGHQHPLPHDQLST